MIGELPISELMTALIVAVVAGATVLVIVRIYQGASSRPLLQSMEQSIISRRFIPRLGNAAFGTMFSAYVVILSSLSILKQQSFHTAGYDVGVFDQVVWNSLKGRLLLSSINVPETLSWESSHLAIHFSPILLALIPLYAVWSDPRALLIFQSIALASAALPIYWLARKSLGYFLACCICLAFFLSPSLQYVNLTEFHEISIAVPLLVFATYFLIKQRELPFLICLGLAFLVKEEIGLIAVGFGVFTFLKWKRWLGLAIGLFGLCFTVLLVQYVIPGFARQQDYYFAGFLYSSLGSSPTQILISIVTRPDLVLKTLLIPEKIEFVLHLFAPLAFLPLLGLEISILSLPTFGYLLLSTRGYEYAGHSQHPAPILPFLFIGSIVGLQRLARWYAGSQGSHLDRESRSIPIKMGLGTLLLVASVSMYFFQAPGPFAKNFDPGTYSVEADRAALGSSLMQMIPSNAVVLAEEEFVPHLSQRRFIYQFPWIPDYRRAEWIFADTTRFWYDFHKGAWDQVLQTGYFEIVAQQDGYILARRRPLEHSTSIRYDGGISLLGYTIPLTETLRGGQTLRPIVYWRAEQKLSARYVVQVRLLDKEDHIWAEDNSEPEGGNFPTNSWKVGEPVGDQYTLSLPPTMPPSDYRITIGVYDPSSERNLVANDSSGQPPGDSIVLDTVPIEKDKSSITASDLLRQFQLEQPYFVDMGEIRLIGFKPIPKTIAAGQLLPVGIYWRAREKPKGDYTVTVQLRDASGQVVFEQASRPANNTYPTTQWGAGEVLLDWHDLTLPETLAPSDYTIQVVLTDSMTGKILGATALSKLTTLEP